ncbi:hypothetical protein B0H19DRAFT_1250717 [Mycena capillaripes]|nr:hypothetical protein B0H19DRAFT_1250717 [Mycena capillaripes]
MSAATRKDHVFALGIFKTPEHLSEKEFETKLTALSDVFCAIPAIQRCLVRWEMIRWTGHFDQHVKPLGFAESQLTILFKGEYEAFQDPEVKKYFVEAAEIVQHPRTYGFSPDVAIWHEDPSRENNNHTVAIFKAPPHLSKDEFQTQIQALITSLIALPAAKRGFVKFEVWQQNESADLQTLGFPVAEHTIVIHAAGENYETMIEFTRDAEVQKLLAESGRNISFHEDSVWFSADVIPVVENYERRK